jgi:hypothetical protein
MNKDWFLLVEKYDFAGARSKFESICESLFKQIYLDKNVKTVKANPGDEGIDVFIGEIGMEPIDVIQCKFFPNSFEQSQKTQIKKSFNTALDSTKFEIKSWTLCVINIFDVDQHIWWNKWKNDEIIKRGLDKNFIHLKDGNDLIDLLKCHDLYTTSFELENSLKISDIHDIVFKRKKNIDLKKILQKASFSLFQVKNYLEKNTESHIIRKETKQIHNWIVSDLKRNKKNILVLNGEKGIGKSTILKDLYDLTTIDENYNVLGIKADKFYANSIKELESKLFINDFTFTNLIEELNIKKEKLVVIIDQIDALSLTLSSNREYIQTYNRLIAELINEQNVRIIISTRSFDLEYDAELSVYNSNEYTKIKADLLTVDEVQKALTFFKIQCNSNKFLELLRTPNHLEIFCKLENRDKINLDTLSTLKDLYDSLWKQHISSNPNLDLKNILFVVSSKMYTEQRITIINIFNDSHYNEIFYLNSNQLLIEENKELHFFHQTFYEYCFAKQFVENGGNLENYILENDQSLYVRSVIKMVVEYLREYDIKRYLAILNNILISKNYRFHIKTLLLSSLGTIQNPVTLEKELVLDVILKNDDYEEVFIGAINSLGWIDFLITENVPEKYFNIVNKDNSDKDKTEKHSNYNWFLFANNINNNTIRILEYLSLIIDFEDKNDFISRLLIRIDDWSDENLLYYFDEYVSYSEEINRRDNFWYYEIMKKIFFSNEKFVFDKLINPIKETFNENVFSNSFSYDLNSIIEESYKINPQSTFQFLLEILNEIVEESKVSYFEYEIIETPLCKSFKIIDNDNVSYDSEEKVIENYLYKHIESQNEEYIRQFHFKYKNHNSISILKVLVKGLKINPKIYSSEIIELIKILKEKNVFNGRDDEFQLFLRLLISSTYVYLNIEQKKFINETLLSIKSKYDVYLYTDGEGKRKFSLRNFGKKKFLFIKSLPSSEISINIDLNKNHQELVRRFGDLDYNKALDSSRLTSGAVRAPLSQKAYLNMNLKSWGKSIIKYDENYCSSEFLKGGLQEHSREFKNIVTQNPDKFFDFINGLFENSKIHISYISSGIDGLIDAKYDPEKVKILFKKLLKLNLDGAHIAYTIWKTRYFLETETADFETVTFLSNIALNYTVFEKEYNSDKPLLNSINSIRGSAVHYLMDANYENDFEEVIFSTIERVIENSLCNNSVKVDIINRIAILNYMNLERAFNIFKKLTNTDNVDLLKYSLNSGQYYNNKFHREMRPYFDKIMSIKEIHKDCFVIVSSWLNDWIDDKGLYDEFVVISDEAKLCALKVAENYLYQNEKLNPKAISILFQFLDEKGEDFASKYSGIILRKFKKDHFMELFHFLELYSQSLLCKKEPRYFFDFLIECSKNYPIECLILLSKMDFGVSPPKVQKRGYYDKEPIQLVLAIYSKLISENKKDKTQIKIALDIFDNMLKHRFLRNNANNAIELIL